MIKSRNGIHIVVATFIGLGGALSPPSGWACHGPSRQGTLRPASSMSVSRAAHTATSLADGDVLIVGGFTGGEAQVAGAELFDQREERFTVVGQPHVLRQSHTATRLTDGRVLVTGGLDGDNQYLSTAELYDPKTRSFQMTGRMTVARASHEAVLLDDGRVLLVGGVGTGWTFLGSAEIYDPRSGQFAAAGTMHEARESHAAVKLSDGRVLIAGGHRGRGNATIISSTAEVYDVATGRFMATGPMTIPRHKHDAVALPDGQVLITGGADAHDNEGVYSSAELFEPVSGRFRSANPMLLGRYKHRGTSFLLSNSSVLLAGGARQAEEYRPLSGGSQLVGGEARMAGQFSAAAALPGGRILITGGYGLGRVPRSAAWIYTESGRDSPPPDR